MCCTCSLAKGRPSFDPQPPTNWRFMTSINVWPSVVFTSPLSVSFNSSLLLSPSFAFHLRCLISLFLDGWSNSVGQHACSPPLHHREKSAMDMMMRCVLDYTFLFLVPPFFLFSSLLLSSPLFHFIFSFDDICSLARYTCTMMMMMTSSLTREAHQTPGTHSFTSSYFSFIHLLAREKGRQGGGEEGGRREGGKGRRRFGEAEFVVLVFMLSLQLRITTHKANKQCILRMWRSTM